MEIKRTVLLVDNSATIAIWRSSSRNLEGVKLVASRDVNVYDLLGHKQVLMSEAAAPEIVGGAWHNGERYIDVIKRPLVTEKGVTKKDNDRTLCFEVAGRRQQDRRSGTPSKRLFKVKVEEVRTSTTAGKLRRRGKFSGYRADWKKAYVRLKAGEKMPEYAEI